MEKIKTSLFFLLIITITISSCRQNDEETTFLKDTTSRAVEMNRKSADPANAINDSNEVETYNSALVLDEDPKFPPRK